jgi:hypothetical protein
LIQDFFIRCKDLAAQNEGAVIFDLDDLFYGLHPQDKVYIFMKKIALKPKRKSLKHFNTL